MVDMIGLSSSSFWRARAISIRVVLRSIEQLSAIESLPIGDHTAVTAGHRQRQTYPPGRSIDRR